MGMITPIQTRVRVADAPGPWASGLWLAGIVLLWLLALAPLTLLAAGALVWDSLPFKRLAGADQARRRG